MGGDSGKKGARANTEKMVIGEYLRGLDRPQAEACHEERVARNAKDGTKAGFGKLPPVVDERLH